MHFFRKLPCWMPPGWMPGAVAPPSARHWNNEKRKDLDSVRHSLRNSNFLLVTHDHISWPNAFIHSRFMRLYSSR